jgi:D-glycero-D-manno-heptose 1,7-bisphosphate phosphatase
MHHAAQQVGATIDAVFFCPHAADFNCDCRKPKPGMIREIGSRYDIELKGVPVVGDSLRDLQAGFIVGCAPHLVLTGKGQNTLVNGGLPPGSVVHKNLSEMVSTFLEKAPA